MRIPVDYDPFLDNSRWWTERAVWPAKWVAHPDILCDRPVVAAYRKKFTSGGEAFTAHVTADQRYILYLDGERLGRGPERGDPENWFFESYRIEPSPGEHVLVAQVWWLPPEASPAYAQMSVAPGFLFAAEGLPPEALNTGAGLWDARILPGIEWVPGMSVTGARVCINGAEYPWGFEMGEGEGWLPVKEVARAASASKANEWAPVWRLRPAMLLPMLDKERSAGRVRHVQHVDGAETDLIPVKSKEHLEEESAAWDALLSGGAPLRIPANTKRRAVIDLEDYCTGYPEIRLFGAGGGFVRIYWAEALYSSKEGREKGNRDEIEGKFLLGRGDIFKPCGEPHEYSSLWWGAGRYLEVLVDSGAEPLVIESLSIRETGYPYSVENRFEASDSRLGEFIPLGVRTLEMCSQETYLDCPYYEQLMYAGDTRLQVLVTYMITGDIRLPKKALFMFDKSRKLSGLTQSRYPSRIAQVIPTFSLWWVAMVHDFAMWRDDPDFVASLMPGVRAVLDAFRGYINRDGLVESPNGWNFVDWTVGWKGGGGMPNGGMPPGADMGVNGTINWQTAMVARMAAELEEMMGEPLLAERNRQMAEGISKSAQVFWDGEKGAFAEDASHTCFSEHTQCMAILSRLLGAEQEAQALHALLTMPNLYRTTISFSHYLFEALAKTGRTDAIWRRLPDWFELKNKGFKTTPEKPEPSRSDCHAWGAHPIYHFYASLLGIRPAKPGFREVSIRPELGHISTISATLPHPMGEISVDFSSDQGKLTGRVVLPEGVKGNLRFNEKSVELCGGEQDICM